MTNGQSQVLISLRDISKTFGSGEAETHVLRGISFDIQQGEFVAIVGPSGSGKSTLLHILGFLDEPTGGDYWLRGKLQRDYSAEDRARVRNSAMGFVFQAFNLLAKTTVYNNVRLPLLYSQVPEMQWDKRVKHAIQAVGLEHRQGHFSSQLSGGEKQRVAIARALVTEPDIIFADEPTGNLDSKSGQVVMDILQRLNQEEGHTVILITHETYTAEMARRIIQIRDGQIASDQRVTHHKTARDFIK